MPWLAALLGLLGPVGLLYTSLILTSLALLLSAVSLYVMAWLGLSRSFGIVQLLLLVLCVVSAGYYASQPPDLRRFPLLARFDRPGWLKGTAFLIVVLGLFWLGARTFVELIGLRGVSMIPTMRTAERALTVRLPLLRGDIRRGTIVIYPLPDGNGQLISRVVALAGDTVEMKRGLVSVNGKPTDDPTRIAKLRAAGCLDENLDENNLTLLAVKDQQQAKRLTVPAGSVFVLADNRATNFEDSRYFGPLPLSQITGVVHPAARSAGLPLTHDECFPSQYRP
ncbi:signal peptidase I [Deinococcus ruber]|uniref:Signal peptidase I n=1 Tax=Deinococcus ruber TaxID=1848197 RepID=A0A918F6B3_9DEIO|nr:signal peptidase I [Deinococcus ruber]GGR05387.1 hypothetical protein GCM10008957_17910 [Deinococcus ruber]